MFGRKQHHYITYNLYYYLKTLFNPFFQCFCQSGVTFKRCYSKWNIAMETKVQIATEQITQVGNYSIFSHSRLVSVVVVDTYNYMCTATIFVGLKKCLECIL